jgi:hypothetical protein
MKSTHLAKFLVLPAAGFLGVISLLGCGRPATEAECLEILRRTAELEMTGRLGDKTLIEAEIQAIEENMRPQMMKKCVGKRVTEKALACVRAAKTSQELAEDCFR